MCAEEYPQILRREDLGGRPLRVRTLKNGLWRVDWTGGLVSLYRADPREYLRRGCEPRHLRSWRASAQRDSTAASDPFVEPVR